MTSPVRIIITSDSLEQLREIVGREDMDLNCGGAKRTSSGEWVVEAYVPQQVVTRLRKKNIQVEVDKGFEKRAATQRAEVGTGDRFQGGRVLLHGVGRKE